MKGCFKCGHKSDSNKAKNDFELCLICYEFSPNKEKDLKHYVKEKVDPDVLETFRKHMISKGEKQKKGMAKKAAQGKLMSRAPFGYKIKEGKLVPAQYYREVEEIFEEFVSKPKEELSLRNLATKHNLSVNGLKKVLRNFTYIGKIKFDNEIYEGDHKPLISTTLFNRAQDRLDKIGVK